MLWPLHGDTTNGFKAWSHDLQEHCQRCSLCNNLQGPQRIRADCKASVAMVCSAGFSVWNNVLWHDAFGLPGHSQKPHPILPQDPKDVRVPLWSRGTWWKVPQTSQHGNETRLQGAKAPCSDWAKERFTSVFFAIFWDAPILKSTFLLQRGCMNQQGSTCPAGSWALPIVVPLVLKTTVSWVPGSKRPTFGWWFGGLPIKCNNLQKTLNLDLNLFMSLCFVPHAFPVATVTAFHSNRHFPSLWGQTCAPASEPLLPFIGQSAGFDGWCWFDLEPRRSQCPLIKISTVGFDILSQVYWGTCLSTTKCRPSLKILPWGLVQITHASISLQLPTGDANIPIKNCLLWYVHKCTYLNMNITFWMERNYLYQWPSLMHCPLRKFHGCCTNTFGQLNSWRRGVGVIQWWLSKWGRSTTICGMLPWMCRLQGWTHGFTTYGQMKSF